MRNEAGRKRSHVHTVRSGLASTTATRRDDRDADLVAKVRIGNVADDDVRVVFFAHLFVDVFHSVVVFEQGVVFAVSHVHKHARSAFDVDIFEKRRGKSHIGSHNTAIFTLCVTRTHQSGAALQHDLADIGKVHMDKAMVEHDAANALDGVAENFVSHLEGFFHGRLLVRGLEETEQLLVFDNDNRVDAFAECSNAGLRDRRTCVTFPAERPGHHGHREDTEFTGHAGNDRSRTRTGSTAHAGSDEHHVGIFHGFLELVDAFFGSLAAHFRIHASAQATSSLFTDLDGMISLALVKGHRVRIHGVVFHALDVHVLHAVHGVSTCSTDAEHLDLGLVIRWHLAHNARLDFEIEVVDFTHVNYLPGSECWLLL